jgi:hypothetical protein
MAAAAVGPRTGKGEAGNEEQEVGLLGFWFIWRRRLVGGVVRERRAPAVPVRTEVGSTPTNRFCREFDRYKAGSVGAP